MDIGEIISDSIKYPSAGWTKVVILGVILIIPIVNFIGLGYLFRIIKATFAGIDELPDFHYKKVYYFWKFYFHW